MNIFVTSQIEEMDKIQLYTNNLAQAQPSSLIRETQTLKIG